MKTFVLPFKGEFGHLIVKQVRNVYQLESKELIVACRRGEEVLFPKATSFFYEWRDVPYRKRDGSNKRHQKWNEPLKSQILEQYGEVNFQPNFDSVNVEDLFVPKSTLNIPYCDVLIGARKRQLASNKNFQHWQKIVDCCKELGKTVGVIGLRDTSFHLEHVDYNSFDLEDTANGVVAMLSNCGLVINTDSGLAHLTTLMQKEQMVIQVNPRKHKGRMGWIQGNRPERITSIPYRAFKDPNIIMSKIIEYFT